jgi:hypothetical protein
MRLMRAALRLTIVLVTATIVCFVSGAWAADLDVVATPASATSPALPPPSFLNDVLPLITRLGCNQGACHGKNDGRNGFKLSLRGYAPEWDYERLTRESRGRRLNHSYPEQSLVLLKATGAVTHGGGQLLEKDSREYRTLLDWIQSGASGPSSSEPRMEQLALSPDARQLKVGEPAQLTVTARYNDAGDRDVTWLTKFFSNDATVCEVSPTGEVRALRNGETAIRAHFQGQVAVSVVTIPFDQQIDATAYAQRNNFIDGHVFNKLAALRIPPSPPASDIAFVRRVFLDTIGTLPTPAEVKSFIDDADPQKRAKLIDSLLERPEYVDYWTLQLGDLLQNRKERDHDVRGTKGVRAMHAWLRDQVAKNRPWDELARDVLTTTGDSHEHPQVGYYIVTVGEKRNADQSEVVASVAQAFLGTRIGCAQCHNHPLEKYTQDDYYHFAAYFAPLRLKREDSKNGPTMLSVASLEVEGDRRRKRGGDKQGDRIGVVQPRTGKFLEPQALDGTACTAAPGEDPRAELAAWIIDPKNEYFAGAMVNRIWRHYMGAGLVEPVDDLRASNPPSNPELWKALIAEFVEHKYDMKHLMRVITGSRAYQLSSATLPTNETDTRYYSHYLARRLPAEVLLDAICHATDRPEEFGGYPLGVRAIQLPDPGLESYFLAQFGRSERVTACACERRPDVTISQLLQLQNGRSLIDKINHADGRLARTLAAIPGDDSSRDKHIIDELYMATLCRPATPDEFAAVTSQLPPDANSQDFFRDLFWALLNSKEFVFNH